MRRPTTATKAEKLKPARRSGGGTPAEPEAGSQLRLAFAETSPPESTVSIEQVVSRQNMLAAYHRVVHNAGAAGVDGVSVEELKAYCTVHWERICQQLLEGTYEPAPVRAKAIPKPGGGQRVLGIPTVIDRMIQQALLQVMTPIFDPDFSDSSFGFRTGRSAHGAITRARGYVEEGYRWVVDIDLEKFFDRVNHDVLMRLVARRITDKRVLHLIGTFLRAGMMSDGLVSQRREGTPQGGPLSPLLSNILLDELDKELERRGHRFVRYADDCNIYVGSQAAGERVMASLEQWLWRVLRLRINRTKSAVDRPWRRGFLGYSMTSNRRPKLRPAAEAVKRFKQRIGEEMRRGRGQSLSKTIATISAYLRGWIAYFGKADVTTVFGELDGWIRRKLRRILWTQWKRPRTRARELRRRGIAPEAARRAVWNGRGPWCSANFRVMRMAFPVATFRRWGLLSLLEMRLRFSSH